MLNSISRPVQIALILYELNPQCIINDMRGISLLFFSVNYRNVYVTGELVLCIIIWRRVFSWELNHS